MTADTPRIEIVTIPCLSDNYAYLLHDSVSGATALVDAPEAAPIRAELGRRGWRLTDILLTHHHDDHVAGVAELRAGARVIGAAADAHRLPALDLAVAPGDVIEVCGAEVAVIDVPGHTVGHIAFHLPGEAVAFTGDSLMALGCGRLFEGTADQMWQSLSRLAALPPETRVYSGHDYTASNGRFALTIEPGNPDLALRIDRDAEARRDGRPVVPVVLADELATNPFLRARLPEVKASVGMTGAADADVFAEIRSRKDRF